jgi:hypothetical protein
MGDVEVDIVGAEAAQAFLDLVGDASAAEITVNRLAVLVEEMPALAGMPDKAAFGGDDDLVTLAPSALPTISSERPSP